MPDLDSKAARYSQLSPPALHANYALRKILVFLLDKLYVQNYFDASQAVSHSSEETSCMACQSGPWMQ